MVGLGELVEWFTDGIPRCLKPECRNIRFDFAPATTFEIAVPASVVETEPDDEDMSMF